MARSMWSAALLFCTVLASALGSTEGDSVVAEIGALSQEIPVVRTLRAPLGGSLCVMESSRKRLRVRGCREIEGAISLLQINDHLASSHTGGIASLDSAEHVPLSRRSVVGEAVRRGVKKLQPKPVGAAAAHVARTRSYVKAARIQVDLARAKGGPVYQLAQNSLEQARLERDLAKMKVDNATYAKLSPSASAALPLMQNVLQATLSRVEAEGQALLAKMKVDKATTAGELLAARHELRLSEQAEVKAAYQEQLARRKAKLRTQIPKATGRDSAHMRTANSENVKRETAVLHARAQQNARLQAQMLRKEINTANKAFRVQANLTHAAAKVATTIRKDDAKKQVIDLRHRQARVQRKRKALVAKMKVKQEQVTIRATQRAQRIANKADQSLKVGLSALAKEKQTEAKMLSDAQAKAALVMHQAQAQKAAIASSEAAMSNKANTMGAQTEQEITAQMLPEVVAADPEENAANTTEIIEVDEIHTAFGGTNTIQASENRFICLQTVAAPSGAVSSIKFTECHQNANCVQSEKSTKCVCGEGYTGNGHSCSRVACNALTPPINGVVRCPHGTLMGSVCKASCNFGFALHGSNANECLNSGQWSVAPAQQRCERVHCKTPPVLEARVLKACNGNQYGSVCELSCEPGYMLEGNPQLICSARNSVEGAWRGSKSSETRCVPVNCGDIATPAGATVTCSGENTQRVCTVQCGSEFEQNGPVQHSCGTDGKWKGVPVKCAARKCPTQQAPEDGDSTCAGSSVGDECRFSCKSKYRLVGAPTQRCALTTDRLGKIAAKWDGLPRRCEEVTCGVIQPVQHGTHTCNGDREGHSCSFQCDPGFRMLGNADITCKADGQWSTETVKCEAVDCGEVVTPDSGDAVCTGSVFGSSCKFSCDNGWALFGSNERKCMEDGKWSGLITQCKKTHCERPADVLNGHQVCTGLDLDGQCKVRCNPGFTMKGDKVRKCSRSGAFSGTAVTCAETVCPNPKFPKDGKVECNGFRYKSTCQYSCEPGYELSGENTRTCETNGLWSGTEVGCLPRSCGALEKPVGGAMKCDHANVDGACTFSCNPGYFANTDGSERRCLPSGEWSGQMTVCTPVDCGYPRTRNATISCLHGTELGNSCNVKCRSGYTRAETTSTTKCQTDGLWSGSLECAPMVCPQPLTPNFGRMECTGNGLGHQCKASCFKGFNLLGSATRVCSSNAQFSGATASCVPVQCAPLQNPTAGKLTCQNTSGATNNYGTNCTVSCDEGFMLEGTSSRVCDENGDWSGEIAMCKPKDCGKPTHIEGCQYDCPWGTYKGSKCSISALTGHILKSAQPVVECMDTGKWKTPKNTTCPPKQCPGSPATNLTSGELSCTQDSFVGSTCHVKCTANMVRSGIGSRECKADLKWSQGNLGCVELPKGVTKLDSTGNHTPAFSFTSTVGSTSVRVMTDSKEHKAFVGLQSSNKTGGRWMMGLLNGDDSFSLCYGSAMETAVCALRASADGTVHFLGTVTFNNQVISIQQPAPILETITEVNKSAVADNVTTFESIPNAHSTGEKGKLLGTSMSFSLGAEPRTEGLLEDVHDMAEEENDIELLELASEETSVTTTINQGAQWATTGGENGIRIDSANSIEGKDAYLEFCNREQGRGWSMGIKQDFGLHVGYGPCGSFRNNDSLAFVNNRIEVLHDAVFHKVPNYNLDSHKLILAPSPDSDHETPKPSKMIVQQGIPDVPVFTNTSLTSAGSTEPLLEYSSPDTDISLDIKSDMKVFLEIRNQMQNRWRITVTKDQLLQVSYRGEGAGNAEATPMVLHVDGSVHFNQPVVFKGSTYSA